MKQNFTLELFAENGFHVLNRIVTILNRRRVRIRRLLAHEDGSDISQGGVLMLLYTTPDMMEKLRHQFEKIIEVKEGNVSYFIGPEEYYSRLNQKHKLELN